MGAAKNRKAEIAQLKATGPKDKEQFMIVEIIDPVTEKFRVMSMPMVLPFMEFPGDVSVAETMLEGFLEGRVARDLRDKWHFANWAFNYVRLGGTKLQTTAVVVGREEYEAFNAENAAFVK